MQREASQLEKRWKERIHNRTDQKMKYARKESMPCSLNALLGTADPLTEGKWKGDSRFKTIIMYVCINRKFMICTEIRLEKKPTKGHCTVILLHFDCGWFGFVPVNGRVGFLFFLCDQINEYCTFDHVYFEFCEMHKRLIKATKRLKSMDNRKWN